MKIYQQINSQGFHIGTSAHADWAEDKGAIDTDAPVYDKAAERARWDKDSRTWDIRTKEEWDEILTPDTPEDVDV